MLMYARTSLIALALMIFVSSAGASPIVIDTFDSGDVGFGIFGIDSDLSQTTGLPTSETIGGDRDIYITTLDTSGAGSADAIVAGGKIGLGTNTVVAPYKAKWKLAYKYDLNADLIDDDGAPNTGLLLEFVSAEHEYDLYVKAWGPGFNPTEFATITVSKPANTSPHDVFLPYDQFTKTAGFTFTDVGSLDIWVYGVADGDYELDHISSNIPEPGTLVLLTLGAGFMLRRRRRAEAGTKGPRD